MCYMLQATPTDKDGTDSVDKVVHGVDIGGKVSPRRHGARRREETRKEHDAYHEEPHHKHRLLNGVGVVGNNQSERREEQRQ